MHASAFLRTALALALATGCAVPPQEVALAPTAGYLIVAGEALPVDVPVVTFRDPGGFDARLPHRWLEPGETLPSRPARGCDRPRRYSERRRGTAEPWTPELLAEHVDQFVVHYDAAVTSWNCFRVLHDVRGLSVHFLLDLDGRLYQTLDLTARARHAGRANERSIGIEIAHRGAYPTAAEAGERANPSPRLHPPPGGPWLPTRPGHFRGTINGSGVVQHDFTEAQYRTLERLVPELARLFPRIRRDVPRTTAGDVRMDVLSDAELAAYSGLLAHWHVSAGKVDPGPAFHWDRVLGSPEPAR